MNLIENNVLKLKNVLLDDLGYNFHTFGSLDLTGSFITKLPEGLKVGGDLIIGDAKIETLPNRMYIGGDLDLTNALYINSIPKGVVVGGKILNAPNGFIQQQFNHNTISDHMICCDCGTRLVFYHHKDIIIRSHRNRPPETIHFYFGIDNKNFAFFYDNKYILCKSQEEAAMYYDKKERDKRILNLNYEKIQMEDKFSINEIMPIYKNLTGVCNYADDEVKNLLKKENLSEDSILTVKEWIEFSKKAKYFYNYLFVSFFEKEESQEVLETKPIKLSITDIY